LTPRSVFLELGGFDERGLEQLHEVDYCYRLRDLGRRVAFSPGSHLISATTLSPVPVSDPREEAEFRRRYRRRRDLFRSPHLVPGEDGTAIQPRRLVSGGGRPIRAVLCSFTLNWEGARTASSS
jgi:GT2 family glycosyltransferase